MKQPATMKKKAVFLDRDGVINRKAPEGQYVTRWEEMEFLPGALEAVRLLNQAGYFVVIASNQRCVAKGLITNSQLEALHERMRREFASARATIDAIYYCPHDYQPPCQCRKPEPGMLLEAARKHNLDLTASWMIGDSEHDVEAGRRAGCRTVRVIEGGASSDQRPIDQRPTGRKIEETMGRTIDRRADVVASSLLRAVQKVLTLPAVILAEPAAKSLQVDDEGAGPLD
jgi:D-glycero-D-manno-heptose 1,7-bisphosphate phosphatase